jgi:hypothetical protein
LCHCNSLELSLEKILEAAFKPLPGECKEIIGSDPW